MTKIIIILLLLIGCKENEEPLSNSNNDASLPNEIDINWLLVKNLNMEPFSYSNDYVEGDSTGYYFYFTNNSNINNLNLEKYPSCSQEGWIQVEIMPGNEAILNNSEGILSFTYNDENYDFDISDSQYLNQCGEEQEIQYLIRSTIFQSIQRIIYNQDMNYFTLFLEDESAGFETTLNASTPNELIDYR